MAMASTTMQASVVPEQSTISACIEPIQGGSSLRRSRRRISNTSGGRYTLMVHASSASGGGSEIVDANLSVLRKRIHRLRTLEATEGPPEEWMEWEKSCYASYRADVAYLLAGLQSQLLGIRPGVSLFLLSVLLAAMPVAFLLLLRVMLEYWIAQS